MVGRSVCVIASALLSAGLLAAAIEVAAQGRSDVVRSALSRGVEHQPNEALVQFRPGVSTPAKARALARVGAVPVETVAAAGRRGDEKGDLELVRIPPGIGVATALGALELEPEIEFVEPNWIYRHTSTTNDPYYLDGSLWGMYGATNPTTAGPSNSYGTGADSQWANGNHCTGAVVGIIDEGVMTTHPDLAPNIWVNPNEAAGNGVDDDGNGYVDDVNGWNFVSNSANVYDGNSDDHGTHVAGTIGAAGGNGIGVAAAGNSARSNDSTPHYPSSYANANVIAVASITKNGDLSSFSNWGAASVDLGAPGSAIVSTLPAKKSTPTYGSYSGTSMATPHVTGAVALFASRNAWLDGQAGQARAAAIRGAVLESTISTPSLAGKTTTGGRLDVSGF